MQHDREALSELSIGGRWGFHEAQARFGELVERARIDGPQEVTVQDDEAVVVIAAHQLERMLHPGRDAQAAAAEIIGESKLHSLDDSSIRELLEEGRRG